MSAPRNTELIFETDDLDSFRRKLEALGATDLGEGTSRHYYADVGKGTLKVVERDTGWEITEMTGEDGRFVVSSKQSLVDKQRGFSILRSKGHTKVEFVEMKFHDYEYDGGVIGLYVINEVLSAIVIDYPPESLDGIVGELKLNKLKQIKESFNVVLRGTPGYKEVDISKIE